MTKKITKQEHETSMDIVICPLIVINLDEDSMKKIDDELHYQLNTIFDSSMILDDDFVMKSGELHDNPSSALPIVPLDSFPPLSCYSD